jgi:hypothetical protein
MPLIVEPPAEPLVDPSDRETIELRSTADGCPVLVDVYAPRERTGPLPLVLGPHAITWTAAEEYHGGLNGLMRKYHPGYFGLADKYRVIIALPHGHHHVEAQCSLAGPAQIDDMARLADTVADRGYMVDRRRVYTCGLSMGGQEALVLAGRNPDLIAAAVAFNPIIDLAAWYEELATSEVPEIREYNTARRIANEVGGTPTEVPDAYAARSAASYADGLAKVPTLIFWTEQDLVVPRQATHHVGPLSRRIKSLDANSPFAEYNHTRIHGPLTFDQVTRWQLHEWCDYDLAIAWLLRHVR